MPPEQTASGAQSGAAETPPIAGASTPAATGQQASQQQSRPNPDAGGQAAPRPDGLPEQFWKDGSVDVNGLLKSHSELAAFKAEKDSAAASAEQPPEKAEDYKLEVPKDFKINGPDGKPLDLQVDENDPRLSVVREFAAENKLTQSQFSNLLALGTKADMANAAAMKVRQEQEIEKLGTKGTQRVAAVSNWLSAKLGNELANPLIGVIFTAKQVEAYEAIIKAAGGTVPSFSGANREQAPTGVSSEEYAKMSAAQRIDYARSQQSPTQRVKNTGR